MSESIPVETKFKPLGSFKKFINGELYSEIVDICDNRRADSILVIKYFEFV